MANKYTTLPDCTNIVWRSTKPLKLYAKQARTGGVHAVDAYPFEDTAQKPPYEGDIDAFSKYARWILTAIEEEAQLRDAADNDTPFYVAMPRGDGYTETGMVPYLNAVLEDRGVTLWYIAELSALAMKDVKNGGTRLPGPHGVLHSKPRLYRHNYLMSRYAEVARMHPTFVVQPFDLAGMALKKVTRPTDRIHFTYNYGNNNQGK